MIGCARVPTIEQNPALQHDALTAAGAVRIVTDHAFEATATSNSPALVHHGHEQARGGERR